MCCCKCFQYYLETIYWHTIEKHFCFDVNIALYEDEDTVKESSTSQTSSSSESAPSCRNSNNNIYDNMAFYDNVAIIANRSIFIIDSKDKKPKQLEVDGDPQSSIKDTIQFEEIKKRDVIPKEIFLDHTSKEVITEQPKFRTSQSSVSDLTKSEPNLSDAKTLSLLPNPKIIPLIRTNTTSLSSLATISEDHEQNPHLLTPNPVPNSTLSASTDTVKLRKKSLHERRVSKSLTLDIDHKRQEVPIIRQSSFPKFYIDTPEANQNTSTIGTTTIQALETPVAPSGFKFDLRTVVQLEDERRELELLQHQSQQQYHSQRPLRRSVTSVKETKRMQQIRDKLKPIMLLRNASSQSLYSHT